jgi:hypothetical protein
MTSPRNVATNRELDCAIDWIEHFGFVSIARR